MTYQHSSFQLKCCGLVNGPSDWKPVPDSCRCNATDTDCNGNGVYSTVSSRSSLKMSVGHQLKHKTTWCTVWLWVMTSLSPPAALLHPNHQSDGATHGGRDWNCICNRHPAGQHTHKTHTHTCTCTRTGIQFNFPGETIHTDHLYPGATSRLFTAIWRDVNMIHIKIKVHAVKTCFRASEGFYETTIIHGTYLKFRLNNKQIGKLKGFPNKRVFTSTAESMI